jgi:rhodanese-related sulfurtransferase
MEADLARAITGSDLAVALHDGAPLALIDVREPAEYNLAHIPGAAPLPRRHLEARMHGFVPYLHTRIVLCDDDGRRAAFAATTLEEMGYTDVSVLQGGTNRWAADGQPTEWGMNVPSKDFGEKVLMQQRVAEITADELHAMQQRGEPLGIVDTRTPEEHRRFCIPGARSMPGAEVGLRIWELADGERPVVVHCAGRTRSIIGAATLQRMGVQNVFALKNGTSGWRLSGFALESGSDRVALPVPTPEQRDRAESTARRIAEEDGVRFLPAAELPTLRELAGRRNLYFFDVRSREEYEEGHLPGFAWVPGGQLVQATDSYIGVRHSTVVLACDGVTRAAMTASWLKQMGFPEVIVVDGGTTAWQGARNDLETRMAATSPFRYEAARQEAPLLSASALQEKQGVRESPLVLFVGASDEFAAGHVPGSRWLARGWLELRIEEVAPAKDTPIVVTCPHGIDSTLAARTLRRLGYTAVSVLDGGVDAWRAAGIAVEAGLTGITTTPDDVLPATRSFADMMNYLRWEEELGEKYRGTGNQELGTGKGPSS